ncbi:hypothetical protein B296_00051866, partial [Ensete ventricosum]
GEEEACDVAKAATWVAAMSASGNGCWGKVDDDLEQVADGAIEAAAGSSSSRIETATVAEEGMVG